MSIGTSLYGRPNSSRVIEALIPLGVGQLYKVILDDTVDNGAVGLAVAPRVEESCLSRDSALVGPRKMVREAMAEEI